MISFCEQGKGLSATVTLKEIYMSKRNPADVQ